MALVARADAGTTLRIGEHVFAFDDGTRQVTADEARVLRRYVGPVKVEITDEKQSKSKSKGDNDG